MRYPKFARVPLAIMTVGLVIGTICQRLPVPVLLRVLCVVGGLIWFGMLVYVVIALLKPQRLAEQPWAESVPNGVSAGY
jgi:hypothetical protein